MNIILTGFPGCGKSYIGKQLADMLNLKFIDTDELIEAKTGLPITTIFNLYGESYFRYLEKEIVKEIKDIQNTIISVGGGLLTDYFNYITLKENFRTIHLYQAFDICYMRIKQSSRPFASLSYNELRRLYFQRLPFYMRFSDVTIHNIDADITINNINRYLDKLP